MVEGGSLGAEIRALRALRGLTVAEAARRAAVSRVSLHRWEAGEQAPGRDALGRLLDALGADPRERARVAAEADPRRVPPVPAADPLGAGVHPGHLLRALRESRGATQDALAARAGVSRQAVAKWEAGQAMPDAEALAHAAELLGAGALGLHEGSLDLYDPIVDPLDARMRLRERPDLVVGDGPLAIVRMLALERELWPLAARDPRWEEPLVETLAWRAYLHAEAGEQAIALKVGRRAMRLAEAGGLWDAAYHAALAISEVRSKRGGDLRLVHRGESARLVPFWRDYAARTRHPLVRADSLSHGILHSGLAGDQGRVRRILPQIEELVRGGEPDEVYDPDLPNGPMGVLDYEASLAFHSLRMGDLDRARGVFGERLSLTWQQRLKDDSNRFVFAYVGFHLGVGDPIPEAALSSLDAQSRAARSERFRSFYRKVGPRLGIYAPPKLVPC